MEIKKTEKASLENKRLIFAELGLIAALLVVFAGFESSTRAKEVALLQGNTIIDDEDDILAIPLDTPPLAPEVPALPMLSDEIEIVDVAAAFSGKSGLIAPDTIHPNGKGNLVIAKAVQEKLFSLELADTADTVVEVQPEDLLDNLLG